MWIIFHEKSSDENIRREKSYWKFNERKEKGTINFKPEWNKK